MIYAIGLLAEEDKREAGKAKRAINALATATGGAVYYPKDASKWSRWRCRWRATSATSTSSRIAPSIRTWMGASARSK